MPRPERDDVVELGIQLRLVGMDWSSVGSVLGEVRDHLESSGQDPREAFGDPADHAAELAEVHRDQLPARPFSIERGDLVASASQIVGFLLLLGGFGAAALGVIGLSAALMTFWDEPVLARVPPWMAIGLGIVLVAACWIRAWRLRDPVRRPTDDPAGVREE